MSGAEAPARLGAAGEPPRSPVVVRETERLVLRHMARTDADFILGLLNEPSFLRFVGDRGVRTVEDAESYISNGPMASYARFGFGLFLCALRSDDRPIGMCGLLKRDSLPDVDIGFALRPAFWSQGYAAEAATAVLALARETFGLARVVAITNPDNEASNSLLQRLGFQLEDRITMPGETRELNYFGLQL